MKCSFCGIEITSKTFAIGGREEACICETCAKKACEVIEAARSNETSQEDVQKKENRLIPETIKTHLDQYVIGQERAKEVLSVALYNHYKRLNNMDLADKVEIDKSNVLLLGPTGCGKTHLVKTLAKLFDVPFAIADATSITQSGYVGEDPEVVLQKLIQCADGDIKKAERGIIFIDEIDKLSRKSENISITRDVGGESVQQALLKIIEGSVVNVQTTGSRKNPHGEMWQIDTSKILFICGGSFEGIEKIVEKRTNKNSGIGFGCEVFKKDEMTIGEAMLQVNVEDLRKFGMIPELLGRLPIIAPLHALDKNTLINIMKEPKNSIYKQYQTLFAMDGITLTIEDDAFECIAEEGIARKTGARSLRSIMEEILLPYMYKAPNMAEKELIIRALDIQTALTSKQTNPQINAVRA